MKLAVWGSLGVMVAAAWGQEVGESAPDVDFGDVENAKGSGSLLEQYSNRIIVLVYWSSIDSSSVELLSTLNELHEKYHKRGVVFVAVTREKKEKAESTVKGKEVKFPVAFAINPERPYRFSAPLQAYIIDIHGKVAYARFHAEDDLEQRIKDLIKRAPPPGADEESLKRRFAKLSQLLGKKEYGRAYTIAKELENILEDEEGSQAKQLETLIEQIEKGAEDWLTQARKEIETKDHKAACAKLAELSVRFEGSNIKEQADREIGRLQGDNYTKAIVRKALDNAEGELQNDDAADLEVAQQYLEARELYREVAEEYENTEAAKAAQEAIDRINSDPKILADIRRLQAADEAARWYDLGERFARVQMFDLAREQFEKVIDKHADDRAAKKARSRLGSLAKEERRAKREAERRAAEKTEKEAKEAERAKAAAEGKADGDKTDKAKKPKRSKKADQAKKPKPKKPQPKRPERPRRGGGGARPVGP